MFAVPLVCFHTTQSSARKRSRKDEITVKMYPIHTSTHVPRGEERRMGEGPREADSLVEGQANIFNARNLASRNGVVLDI